MEIVKQIEVHKPDGEFYDKAHSAPIYTRLQRWVNNRFIFGTCQRFEDYMKTRTKEDDKQIKLSL